MSILHERGGGAVDQTHLMAGLQRVHRALESCGEGERWPLPELPSASPAESPLAAVCAIFGLSEFERDVLLLCAAMELEGDVAELCAEIQGERMAHPTFGLALARLEGAHWSALGSDGPLRHWRLIETSPASTLASSALRIDERILHYLMGGAGTIRNPAPGLEYVVPTRVLLSSESAIADRLGGMWHVPQEAEFPLVFLTGAKSPARRAIAVEAAHRSGFSALVVDGAFVPMLPVDQVVFRRSVEREALLERAALLVEVDDVPSGDPAREVARGLFLSHYQGPAVVLQEHQEVVSNRASLRVEASRLDVREQAATWRSLLDLDEGSLLPQLQDLVGQFSLSYEEIASVAAAARGIADDEGRDRLAAAWAICRDRSRATLDALAQRVETLARWEDLILPAGHLQLLKEAAAQVQHRVRVHEEWGFAGRSARGLGISALFWGASGTGKTMAAEAMAGSLGLDLYRIDLSAVVSKYIGETEKNLRQVFDAADDSGAILLFDEADALFGKRSEVKDSHDRFANIEVGYLLQRLEAYRGLAILTTNLRDSMDPAFTRRIRFSLEFTFPDYDSRVALWKRAFPARTPTQGLDAPRLAQLSIAGGNIRNIAIYAAFLAADEDKPVTMAHVLRAARFEYEKLGRPLGGHEIRGWA